MKGKVPALALIFAVGMLLGVIAGQALSGQHIKVSTLLTSELAGLEGKEALVQVVEVAPGGAVPKHYHPGHEVTYVLGGTATLEIEGRPPLSLKAGDVVHIPAKAVHWGMNGGAEPLKLVVFRIHEKGQPVTIPVQ